MHHARTLDGIFLVLRLRLYQSLNYLSADLEGQCFLLTYFRINGVPACANEWLLTDLLRNEWEFDGYVVSDEGAIEWMLIFHNYTDTIRETAAEAVNAGNVKIKRIQERYKNT